MFERISGEFGTLDVLVSNARVELATDFYQSPLEIPLDKFELTFDSQVRAFHVLTRHIVEMLPGAGGGRIIAISYSPSGRTGSWGKAGSAVGQLVAVNATGLPTTACIKWRVLSVS
jgi:NAD(P)-dependent dehydrogenase (short-subunit alcohol dehydrogenase family)